MDLLDQVTNKIREMKEDGIALASIKLTSDNATVEIVIGSLETRDIYEPGKDGNPAKSSASEDDDLDLYHVR